VSPVSRVAALALAALCLPITACGRAAAPKPEIARRPTACSLITREEMARILEAPLGRPIAADAAARTSCAYPPGDAGSWAQAEVAIEWDYRGGATFEQQMTDAFGGSAVGRQAAHPVRLGDAAAYSREGVLSIRQGTALITITLPMRENSETYATAIGRTVLERLGDVMAAASASPHRAVSPATVAPVAKPAAPSNDADDALKGLVALFGDDDKPDAAKPIAVHQAGTPAALPFPAGFEPEGSCPDPGASVDAELAAAATATIPLVEGMTLASTWTSPNDHYDHECLKQITRIDHVAVTVTMSCPNGADRHLETATRRLCLTDLRQSYMYETAFGRDIPETIRGALSLSLSAASF
jgi:hypothetical protein